MSDEKSDLCTGILDAPDGVCPACGLGLDVSHKECVDECDGATGDAATRMALWLHNRVDFLAKLKADIGEDAWKRFGKKLHREMRLARDTLDKFMGPLAGQGIQAREITEALERLTEAEDQAASVILALARLGAKPGEGLTEVSKRVGRDRRDLEFRATRAEQQLAGQLERNAFLSEALSEYVIQLGQLKEMELTRRVARAGCPPDDYDAAANYVEPAPIGNPPAAGKAGDE